MNDGYDAGRATELADLLADMLRERGRAVTPTVEQAIGEFVDALLAEDDSADELIGAQTVSCPYCGSVNRVAIDLSGSGQDEVQDCETCCRPMRITYTISGGRPDSFSAGPS